MSDSDDFYGGKKKKGGKKGNKQKIVEEEVAKVTPVIDDDSDDFPGGKKQKKGGKKGKKIVEEEVAPVIDDDSDDLPGGKKQKKGGKKGNKQKIVEEEVAPVDDDSDDDPVFGKKKAKKVKVNPKKQQREQRQKKGKAQAEEESDEDAIEAESQDIESTKNSNSHEVEEQKEEKKAQTEQTVTYPLKVIYCALCSIPPEYCAFSKVGPGFEKCKDWLKEAHPDLFSEIYEGETVVKAEVKKKKNVGFQEPSEAKITILKMKRSGKKIQSVIIGLEHFGCDLAAVAKLLSKKFATGANQAETDHHGVTYNAIQVQGDVAALVPGTEQPQIEKFLLEDLAKYKIPKEALNIEDAGNKKGRKR